MKHRLTLAFILTTGWLVSACGSGGSSSNGNGGQGGNPSTGGTSATGGASAGGSGGASASGGAATGGTTAKGGAGGTNTGGSSDPGTPISFTVDPAQDNHAISPSIYCQSVRQAADATTVGDLAKNLGLGLVRVGGNRFSAYNWENNASNAGSDYQFQNDDYVSASDVPGAGMEGSLATADTGLIAALVTGQLGDYVAADKKGGGDVTTTAD